MIFFSDATDDPLAFDSCPRFDGGQVSFKRANLLGVNEAAKIENFDLQINGELKKRRGSRPVGNRNFAGSSYKTQGIFYFQTPTRKELIGFSGGTAWNIVSGTWANLFSANITDTTEVPDICQLTDKLFWTDSNKTRIRTWDGTTVSDLAGSPQATNVCSLGTRLVASGIATAPSAVDFSGFLAPSTWDSVNLRLYIGNGDGDPIVGHIPWQDSNLIVCKKGSTWVVDCNPLYSNAGTSVAAFPIKLIHNAIGCVSKNTMVQVGQDIWFLSRNGVMSIQKQLATSNNQISTPISQPIQDIINKINWNYAYKATAEFHNNRYILSIPVSSSENNTTLVFNTLTGSWSTITGWNASCFYRQQYNGGERLLYGTLGSSIYEWLDYEAADGNDSYLEAPGTFSFPITFPITFPNPQDFTATLRTRAMTFNEPVNPKSGFYLELEYVTSSVSFAIYAILDGAPPVLLESIVNDVPQVPFPITFPVSFPSSPGWAKQRFPLHQLPFFREIQLEIICTKGCLNIHEVTLSAFVDTMELRRN